MRFSALPKAAKLEILLMWASLKTFLSAQASKADTIEGDGLVTRARNAGTVISVVVIGVVALVGILIFGQVHEAMTLEEGDELYESSQSILDGFGNAMEFVPIILLVLLASVVIAVVQRMRQ